ncbi:hypothetical protein FBUS_11161 [Fasciolopsis buskii]|uniref:Uncharacterized protein n=1 Tax=Fasciolopsis buskii TaxID=27845 RepID=A0A8E0RLW6_9TREM|nr:hypothetical protein FBUS_11161 [Fasciolopsis buski]
MTCRLGLMHSSPLRSVKMLNRRHLRPGNHQKHMSIALKLLGEARLMIAWNTKPVKLECNIEIKLLHSPCFGLRIVLSPNIG